MLRLREGIRITHLDDKIAVKVAYQDEQISV
jgi:hypothetical protein